MNQVSFDISSERRGSEVAVTAVAVCSGRSIVRIFGLPGLDRVSTLHETPAAALRHEPYPVAA